MSSCESEGARLILASKSPRRKELLSRLSASFVCINMDVEELNSHPDGSAALALRNAIIKADVVADSFPTDWVLGSDTVVSDDNHSLGKPKSVDEAFDMIRRLSGKEHQVYTGVSLVNLRFGKKVSYVEESCVRFFDLTNAQISNYLSHHDAGEYAGGYPIQHVMGSIVAGFSGSYTNIVGLPIESLKVCLEEHGIV